MSSFLVTLMEVDHLRCHHYVEITENSLEATFDKSVVEVSQYYGPCFFYYEYSFKTRKLFYFFTFSLNINNWLAYAANKINF